MANAWLGYEEPGTVDKRLDAESLTVAATTVMRERIQVSGTADVDIAPVSATDGLLVNLGANNDITGTVTANAGTDLNTSLLALESGGNLAAAAASLSVLDDWDETNRCAVNTISGQVGVAGGAGNVSALTQRVVLATDVALPAGTNAIGKLAANSGVDIGDVDVTSVSGNVTVIQATASNLNTQAVGAVAHDSAVSGNPILNAGEARDTLGTAVATGDVVRLAANRYGAMLMTAIPPSHASSNGTPITATTTSVIAAPSAGSHLRIVRIHMSNGGSTATWVAIRDGAAGTRHYNTYLPLGGVMSLNLNYSGPLDLTSATRLDIFLSAAGSVEYEIDYLTVAD